MSKTNAQAFVARGLAMKRGRPRKPIYIPENEYDFIDRPIYRRSYGKSESVPGRICSGCREFLPGPPVDCVHCDKAP